MYSYDNPKPLWENRPILIVAYIKVPSLASRLWFCFRRTVFSCQSSCSWAESAQYCSIDTTLRPPDWLESRDDMPSYISQKGIYIYIGITLTVLELNDVPLWGLENKGWPTLSDDSTWNWLFQSLPLKLLKPGVVAWETLNTMGIWLSYCCCESVPIQLLLIGLSTFLSMIETHVNSTKVVYNNSNNIMNLKINEMLQLLHCEVQRGPHHD